MVKTSTTLHVFMNGIPVGYLMKNTSGGLVFIYDDNWLNQEDARPLSLSLPLTLKRHEGDVVYNFFDNLLPDNDQIRARIQTRFQISTQQPFDLLASIGRDCVGAIQLCADNKIKDIEKISGEELSHYEIAKLLKGYRQAPLGMSNEDTDFRISIAGAQEKTALLFWQDKWFKPTGATPTTHILKLPIGFIEHQHIDLSDSCENEWLCTQIAKAFDLPVAHAEIFYFEEVKALAVKRFDRKLSNDNQWIMRLPQEDMCQALGYSPHLKYQADGGPGIESIMSLLLGSERALSDREQFFKTQILFWLLAAIDGHAKNFSIFIRPSGRFFLTPLYDIMSAYPLLANGSLQKQKIKMAMALKGKNNHYHWYNIQLRHFISTAKNAHYSPTDATKMLEEMLSKIDTVIATVAMQLPKSFPNRIAEPIFEGMINISKKTKEY